MAARRYYVDVDGRKVRVPGVTTIIGQNLGWSKEGLMRWAWGQGIDGVDLDEARKPAAETGTTVHELIEGDLRDLPFEDVPEKARNAFDAWRQWRSAYEIKPVRLEHELVDAKLRFGGCVDCVAEAKGRLILLDWKTSNSVYEDYIIQLAAYRHLCVIHGFDIAEAHLVRFSKQDGAFGHHFFPSKVMDKAWEAFTACLALHETKKQLKGCV